MADCTVRGCTEKHDSRGFCTLHYTRFRRHGDPLVVLTRHPRRGATLGERLAAFSREDANGCLIFNGDIKPNGYGAMHFSGRRDLAHRWAWRVANGMQEIPRDLVVRHSCDVRRCINPDHLSLGTQSQNVIDAISGGRRPGTVRLSEVVP